MFIPFIIRSISKLYTFIRIKSELQQTLFNAINNTENYNLKY